MEIKVPNNIQLFITALFVDAVMSFIVFSTTAYFFWGSAAGKVAFIVGMVLMWNVAVDAANQGKAKGTLKGATGLDMIVRKNTDLAVRKGNDIAKR